MRIPPIRMPPMRAPPAFVVGGPDDGEVLVDVPDGLFELTDDAG